MDGKESLDNIFHTLKDYLPVDALVSTPDIQQSLIYKLKVAQQNIICNNRSSNVLQDIDAVMDFVWEDLHTGCWSTVPEKHRKIFAVGSLLKITRIIQEILNEKTQVQERLEKAIEAADFGLLMGTEFDSELSTAAKMLSNYSNEEFCDRSEHMYALAAEDEVSDWCFLGIKGKEINCETCPSLEHFLKHYFSQKVPVKLKECISHWPALDKWKDGNYLIKMIGPRMVPVELGSSYDKNDWSMKMIRFQEFFKSFISNKSASVGYLAQHQLFDQIPELKNDICIPDYCCLSENEENPCEVDLNAWFGPAGTVSPLHFDPKHNLLAQVIGRKRIILCAPEDSEKVYPHETELMHNTAKVDPYSPNYEKYPEFKKCKLLECHLYPGEMLYIPPKWWHHVRSLDISFSVSFWWQ